MQMSKTQLPITLSTLLPHAILHGDFSVLFFRELKAQLLSLWTSKSFFPPLVVMMSIADEQLPLVLHGMPGVNHTAGSAGRLRGLCA